MKRDISQCNVFFMFETANTGRWKHRIRAAAGRCSYGDGSRRFRFLQFLQWKPAYGEATPPICVGDCRAWVASSLLTHTTWENIGVTMTILSNWIDGIDDRALFVWERFQMKQNSGVYFFQNGKYFLLFFKVRIALTIPSSCIDLW